MEIFILYNKEAGFIKSSGRINRELDSKNRDGSTMLEYVERKLVDPELAVVYLPDQILPDSEKHKIVDGKIIELTETDKQPMIESKINEEKIQKKIRKLAIESLKASRDLAKDYK